MSYKSQSIKKNHMEKTAVWSVTDRHQLLHVVFVILKISPGCRYLHDVKICAVKVRAVVNFTFTIYSS